MPEGVQLKCGVNVEKGGYLFVGFRLCESADGEVTKVPPDFTACATFFKMACWRRWIGEPLCRGAPAGIGAASLRSQPEQGIHEDAVV